MVVSQQTAKARNGGIAAESPLALKRRARRIGRILAQTHPDAHCELDYSSPLELAVATILSAQCTDQRVNQVTPALFARYRGAADYAAADRAELEGLIYSTGFYRNKATSLIRLGQALVERHAGAVPRTMEELVALPGLGRKSANVLIGNAFGGQGIPVDTHFIRLANRWGWTTGTDPVAIEKVAMGLFDRGEWTMLSHRVVFHGRRICFARNPACGQCPLVRLCPSFDGGGRP